MLYLFRFCHLSTALPLWLALAVALALTVALGSLASCAAGEKQLKIARSRSTYDASMYVSAGTPVLLAWVGLDAVCWRLGEEVMRFDLPSLLQH